MTTIAYKDGIIAYDSRKSADWAILDDNCDKMDMANGRRFFLTGPSCDSQEFVAKWPDISRPLDTGGFMVEDGKVYRVSVTPDGKPWKSRLDVYWAEGSGADHAITAMDLGLSAKDAVKMAAKRDMATGGKIRTYRIRGRNG